MMWYFLWTLVTSCVYMVSSQSCPTGFIEISSRCYYVSVNHVEGNVAEMECIGHFSEAALAVFQTDDEKQNVAEFLSLTNGTRYAIGPYPACDEGCYTIRPMTNLVTPLIGQVSCGNSLEYICETGVIYDVPDDVTITTITTDSTSITVHWSYSSPSTSYTGFSITGTPSTGAQAITVDVSSTDMSATLSDLYSGTEYDVTVYAINEDQLSSGVTMGTFTYPGDVPCFHAANADMDITISWSSAAGQFDGYRVWAYVTDKTQEDEETSDSSTLSHTFRGKDRKTYAIDIYSYVWIDGVQYWSSPIEADFELDKNEERSINEGSYPCTAVTPAPIVTTSSPLSTTFCPVVDMYTTTLPTTTGIPSTLQTTTDGTTTVQTTSDPTTTVPTTSNPTTTVQTTRDPTTTVQTTDDPTTTLQTTTDLPTTIQTTSDPTTTLQTTTDLPTTVQTTSDPTTTLQTTTDLPTTVQTTSFATTTVQTTSDPTTTLQTTTDPTTTSADLSTASLTITVSTTVVQTTSHATTTVHATNEPSTVDPTINPSALQTISEPGATVLQGSSGIPTSLAAIVHETETPVVQTDIYTAILETTLETHTVTSSTDPNATICDPAEGVLNSEDYIALIPSGKANFAQDVISDLIYYINETRDADTVYSYMESVWPSLFGSNCQPIAPIKSMTTPFMIEYFGATLMEHLLNVTDETLDIAFYDVGIIKEFRLMVNLLLNDSDAHLTFGGRNGTFVEIPTTTLRNGDCCKGLMFILYNEAPLDEDLNHCADSDQCEGKDIMIADFLSLEIFPPNPKPFNAPIVFHFTHNQAVMAPNETLCVWLGESTSNHGSHVWNTSGCVTINETGSRTRCECDHLTSFSILMKVTEYDIPVDHGKVLSILTFIGCGASIVCAVIIVVLFLCFRLMREERILHSMLLVAIASGQLAFLLGINRTENKIACKVVAIVIQYFMTASFSWMLIESIYLYRYVMHVFSSRVNIIYYVIAGWGVPAGLVGISLGISYDRIPSENFCWLSTDGGAIYAFVGPALAVIIINTILLAIVLREIRRIIDRDITKIEISKAKTTAKTLFVFMPIMGAPWLFGVLAINGDTVIFDYLFTALNSFQGLMIFLIHTVGNKEFRSKIYRGKRKVDPYATGGGRAYPSSSGVTTTTMVMPMRRENSGVDNF